MNAVASLKQERAVRSLMAEYKLTRQEALDCVVAIEELGLYLSRWSAMLQRVPGMRSAAAGDWLHANGYGYGAGKRR